MCRLLLVVLLLPACGEPAGEPITPTLGDGIYEVVGVATQAAELRAGADTRVLRYDREFIRGGSEEPPEYVLLRVPGHAPLDLAEAPKSGEANGRPALLLKLRPDAGQALTKLTTRAKRAAVVIGGKIVTMHGIKVPIEGGALQVSC